MSFRFIYVPAVAAIFVGGAIHATGCATSGGDTSLDGPESGAPSDNGVPEAGAEPDGSAADSGSFVCDGKPGSMCTPLTSRITPCGICGTQTDVCQRDCQYAIGSCTGERVDGCKPGFVKTTAAGCTGGEVSAQRCDSTCGYGAPGPCGPPGTLTIEATTGSTVSMEFTLSPLTDQIKTIIGDPYYECPTTIESRTTSYVWIKVSNPTSSIATVSAWTSRSDGSITDVDTLAAWYARTTIPATDSERRQCSNRTNDKCDTAPCIGSGYPGFIRDAKNDSRITIPANSFIVMYVGAYHPDETGSFVLNARTDALK